MTSVPLYGAEMWGVTSADIERLGVDHRKCLRRILWIFWAYALSNRELYERAKESPISNTVKVRRWRWTGDVLRREKDNNFRVVLTWTSKGKRRRGRPKITWRRSVEDDLGWTSLNELEQEAKDRVEWQLLLRGLYMLHYRSKEDE